MDQENPLNIDAKQICYQQLFFGQIKNQETLFVNLQPLSIPPQDSEITDQNNSYSTECFFQENIYYAQVSDKTVVLEKLIPQQKFEIASRWRVQFNLQDQIAQNGCWFQLHMGAFLMVIVDVRGNLYVQSLQDIQESLQPCILGKINDVNYLYQVEQIHFDSEYAMDNENIASTSIGFVASIGTPDRIIYVEINLNSFNSFYVQPLYQVSWGSSFLDKLNPFRAKVQKTNRNPIKNMIRLTQNHTLVFSHSEELKIFIHKPALRQYKIANISYEWFQQIAKIKFFDFASRRDTNIRVGNHFLGTLVAFHHGKLQIFELDFIQKSPLNSFSNIKNLIAYNVSLNQKAQNFQDIPNFDFHLDLINEIEINYQINSVFMLNNHFLIQSINENTFILQFNKDDQKQFELSRISSSEYDILQKSDYLHLVMTKHDMFFSLNEQSMTINLRIQNKLLAKSSIIHSKIQNLIQTVFTTQQQQDLVYSFQAIPRQKEEQFESLIQSMKNFNILSIATFQQDFRKLCYDIFINGSKHKQPVSDILNDILIENYDLIIYLKQYFQYSQTEEDQRNLQHQISSLLESVENFLQEFSKDNIPFNFINKEIQEKIEYQINVQYGNYKYNKKKDGLRTFMIQIFNFVISKILLLLLPTQNQHQIENFLKQHERAIRNLFAVVYFVDQRESLLKFLKYFSEGEEINIFKDMSRNIINIINLKISQLTLGTNENAQQTQIPLIIKFLYEQKIHLSSIQVVYAILSLVKKMVQNNFNNPIIDFIQNIIELNNIVNQLDEDEFQRGPWYNQYYSKDVYIQMLDNKLSFQERLIVLLLKNNDINDKCKYLIAKKFFREVIEKEQDELIDYKNKIMQQTLFRALFDSALNLKLDQEVLQLLRRKELLRDGYDAFSITQQRVSLMEQFINAYFNNFRYEDLMGLDLDRYILTEIFYHLKIWNNKTYHKDYVNVYRNLKNVNLKYISQIFFKQSDLLKSRQLLKESLQILYSFYELLCLIKEEDIRTKQYFQIILQEQINILSNIIQQYNDYVQEYQTWNSSFIFLSCQADKNDGQISDEDENQKTNYDLKFLNIEEIQKVAKRLEIKLYVYENYRMKVEESDDLEFCLICKEDYGKLIQLWSTGEFEESNILSGIQIMIIKLKDQDRNALCKFLSQIIKNNAFKKERNQVLKLLVHSYLVQKISPQISTFDQLVDAFSLQNDIIYIVQIIAYFNLKIMNSKLLVKKLTDLINLRNSGEIQQEEGEFLHLINNLDQDKIFSSDIINIIKSKEFLQEQVF